MAVAAAAAVEEDEEEQADVLLVCILRGSRSSIYQCRLTDGITSQLSIHGLALFGPSWSSL